MSERPSWETQEVGAGGRSPAPGDDSSIVSSRNFPCGAKAAADLPELLQSQHLAQQLQVFHGKSCPVLSVRCWNFSQSEVI